jgi:hypothetical protein
MFSAYMDVKYHELSVYRAAKNHGVSLTTLQRRMKDPFPQRIGDSNLTFSSFDEDVFVELLRKFEQFDVTITFCKFFGNVQ